MKSVRRNDQAIPPADRAMHATASKGHLPRPVPRDIACRPAWRHRAIHTLAALLLGCLPAFSASAGEPSTEYR
ncbi:MAG TPA: hypothetical protein VET88_06540, partial [Gammaproteobacteria bacterium]|nr:hypothetical protein [Gammaproteobacteria bacterium]